MLAGNSTHHASTPALGLEWWNSFGFFFLRFQFSSRICCQISSRSVGAAHTSVCYVLWPWRGERQVSLRNRWCLERKEEEQFLIWNAQVSGTVPAFEQTQGHSFVLLIFTDCSDTFRFLSPGNKFFLHFHKKTNCPCGRARVGSGHLAEVGTKGCRFLLTIRWGQQLKAHTICQLYELPGGEGQVCKLDLVLWYCKKVNCVTVPFCLVKYSFKYWRAPEPSMGSPSF